MKTLILELLAQSPSPSSTRSLIETETFPYIFEVVLLAVGGIAGFIGKIILNNRRNRKETEAQERDHNHQTDLAREDRNEQRRVEELKGWQELIGDLRTVLTSDYSQYDDPDRTKRAREQWDRNLQRRLTGLAAFTTNIPARKIAHHLRVEFHRLRETTFFFQNNDHTHHKWEEQYQRFDIAWNEALFLIGKLTEACGGEPAESRANWPATLRHTDDARDDKEFSA
jgi:hypothetical protein